MGDSRGWQIFDASCLHYLLQHGDALASRTSFESSTSKEDLKLSDEGQESSDCRECIRVSGVEIQLGRWLYLVQNLEEDPSQVFYIVWLRSAMNPKKQITCCNRRGGNIKKKPLVCKQI